MKYYIVTKVINDGWVSDYLPIGITTDYETAVKCMYAGADDVEKEYSDYDFERSNFDNYIFFDLDSSNGWWLEIKIDESEEIK